MSAWTTLLFVPGDRPERYRKAADAGADAVIIDLEDAVSPDAKVSARDALCRPGAIPVGIEVLVRINPHGTPWHEADLRALAGLTLTALMLPKAEQATDIDAIRARLALPVIALIETARGLAGCRAIAHAQGVAGLAFGSVDFCADLGMAHERAPLLLARSSLVLESRLAGLPPPIDGVTTEIDDATRVEDDACYARKLGFGGKLCVHPRQIGPARLGFAPGAAELAWARRVLAADKGGVAAIDGQMVDAPVLLQARQLLARAVDRPT